MNNEAYGLVGTQNNLRAKPLTNILPNTPYYLYSYDLDEYLLAIKGNPFIALVSTRGVSAFIFPQQRRPQNPEELKYQFYEAFRQIGPPPSTIDCFVDKVTDGTFPITSKVA